MVVKLITLFKIIGKKNWKKKIIGEQVREKQKLVEQFQKAQDFLTMCAGASDPHLDLGRTLCVLYGVKYIDLVPPTRCAGPAGADAGRAGGRFYDERCHGRAGNNSTGALDVHMRTFASDVYQHVERCYTGCRTPPSSPICPICLHIFVYTR